MAVKVERPDPQKGWPADWDGHRWSQSVYRRTGSFLQAFTDAELLAGIFDWRYVQRMKLDGLQREAALLSLDEQRKLAGFLVALDVRRDEGYRAELARRFDDKDSPSWISRKEAKRQLNSEWL